MIRNLFLSILEISISASPVILLFLALRPLLQRRYAAKWNYLIWIFLALQLVLPLHTLWEQLPPFIELYSVGITTPADTGPEPDTSVQISDAGRTRQRYIVTLPAQLTEPVPLQGQKDSARITFLDLVSAVWLAGCLLYLSIHLINYMRYKNQLQKAESIIKEEPIPRLSARISRELHIKRHLPVVRYCAAGSPMILGFFHPVIVLPEETYDAQELYFILKHELVHYKRRDVFWKLLFMTANALYWFHPLVWILQKEAAVDMELSCDEKVIQNADHTGRIAYTEALLSTLHRHCAKKAALSTQFYGGKPIMKKRFRNILQKSPKKNGWFLLFAALILSAGTAALTGCSVSASSDRAQNTSQQKDADTTLSDSQAANSQTNAEPAVPNMNPFTYGSPKLPKDSAEVLLYATIETDPPASDSITTLAYISNFDGKNLSFDEVEWVEVPSDRAKELGIEEQYLDSGFYIHNEASDLKTLPVTSDCSCKILDWYASYTPEEIDVDELPAVLEERKETHIPYLLTVQNEQIISIEEHYVP